MKGTTETTITLTMTEKEAEVLKDAILSFDWTPLGSEESAAVGEFMATLNDLGVK